MIQGRVNESLEPIVEIGLRREDTVAAIPAVVDSGFSGYLCLAERHIDQLEMDFTYIERYELADGQVIVKDVFRGSIVFDGHHQEVDLILTASQDTLIGASLLKDYKLIIDYPGGTVQIERAAGEPGTSKLPT